MCACTALSRESVAHFGLTFKLTLPFSRVCVCRPASSPFEDIRFFCTRFVFPHRPIINKNPCFIHFVPSSFNPGLKTRVASPQPLGLLGCNTQKQKKHTTPAHCNIHIFTKEISNAIRIPLLPTGYSSFTGGLKTFRSAPGLQLFFLLFHLDFSKLRP